MSRIILMALVLAATVVGCDRFPDLTIQITDNLAPNDPPECGYEVEQEEILFRGFWDLAITADYYMFPRIESYIIDNSLPTQAPPGNMTITSYNVTVKLPNNSVLDLGESLPNPYQVTTNAVIPASQVLGEISRGIAGAPMIPASYQSAIAGAAAQAGFDSFVLDIRANGTTAGGFSQQSPTFSWPIELCTGCLGVRCPDDGENQIGTPTGCLTGQDSFGTYCVELFTPA
jgi:hypothetical protein